MSYLVDKSVLARMQLPAVRDAVEPLVERRLVHICAVTELELGHSARSMQDFEGIESLREALEWTAMPDAWDDAIATQRRLARLGHHRGVGVPDLMIAATARRNLLTVLHYDHDFDLIAEVTAQPTRWVVPQGSVS